MARLTLKYPDAHLIIVGDGPERAALERFAQIRQPEGNVIFTGALTHPETLAVIESADVFVMNSTYEGLSHLLIEAMSLARPIVATHVGGNPELLTDRESALLIPLDQPELLPERMLELLENKILATQLGQRAKERSADFSIKRMVDTTSLFFRQSV